MKLLVPLVFAVVVHASTAHADSDDRWAPGLIAGQAGAVVISGLLFGAGGIGLAVGVGGDGSFPNLEAGALLGAIGVVAGTTIGVKLAGDFADANGKWSWTAGGAIIGGVVTVGVLQGVDALPAWLLIPALGVAMVGPPIVAYHLSIEDDVSAERRIMVPLIVGGF
jgi:hypothetical protein